MSRILDGKVVVISGVGPSLGTALARRCAEAGADLVLAARTAERLDDVAKQITDIGTTRGRSLYRHHARRSGAESGRVITERLRPTARWMC